MSDGGCGGNGRGGAKEAPGLGDCSAFILLSSSLLKHYLRKKDFKAGWLLLGTDLLIPADTRGSAATLWGEGGLVGDSVYGSTCWVRARLLLCLSRIISHLGRR